MSLATRITADARKFTDPELLGTLATWKRPGLSDTSLQVNFAHGFVLSQPDDVAAASAEPAALVATADAPGIARGHKLVITGETYDVLGVEPDGTGLTLLPLSRSPAVAAGALVDGEGNLQTDENGWQVTP